MLLGGGYDANRARAEDGGERKRCGSSRGRQGTDEGYEGPEIRSERAAQQGVSRGPGAG